MLCVRMIYECVKHDMPALRPIWRSGRLAILLCRSARPAQTVSPYDKSAPVILDALSDCPYPTWPNMALTDVRRWAPVPGESPPRRARSMPIRRLLRLTGSIIVSCRHDVAHAMFASFWGRG